MQRDFPAVHIYEFSRLVSAPAGSWLRILRRLEEDRPWISRYYEPLRVGAVALCRPNAKSFDSVRAMVERLARTVKAAPHQDPVTDNLRAFDCFASVFRPQVGEFVRDFLASSNPLTIFEGIALKGAPHMQVRDLKKRNRFVFLYASNWEESELRAYLELLTIVIEDKYRGKASDLWCMNLRDGELVEWKKSAKLIRRSCVEAAQLSDDGSVEAV
jgi:hypothetical protein